jgi:hypothetical protein
MPTDPKRSFEVMFRAYAPTKGFFEKTWKLPDVEKFDPGTGGRALHDWFGSPPTAKVPYTVKGLP